MKHVCGLCDQAFDTEEGYLKHSCPATEFTPQDPQHLGEGFALISQAALKRGEERADEEASQ